MMINDDEDDVPLLHNDDDERLITSEDSLPRIEAVFVITFDVRHGNIIEFQMPEKEQMSLNGIEYKAIPSGSHRINEDFIYFRHETKYGLACLIRADSNNVDDRSALSTIDETQRGLRIKSVGILTSSIIHIQAYLRFLRAETRCFLNESSVDYSRLKQILVRREQSTIVPASIYDSLFFEFVQRFGSAIFPLARLILLGKRILLYSEPPIGFVCNAVYFAHILNQAVNPLFYVSVLDLLSLTTEQSYIGCTTEIILKEKAHIYDVFIDCSSRIIFHTNNSTLKSIVKITRNDRERLRKTITLDEFINIGNRLSRLLNQLSQSNDNQQMTNKIFQSLDLHQRYDRLFINEYIRMHRASNVTMSNSSPVVCPVSPCGCCGCFGGSDSN